MEFCSCCGLGPPPIDDRGWCKTCRNVCDHAWMRVYPLLPLRAEMADALRPEITILIGARLITFHDGYYMRPGLAEGLAWVFGRDRQR